MRGVWGVMTGEGECGGDMTGEGSVGETKRWSQLGT